MPLALALLVATSIGAEPELRFVSHDTLTLRARAGLAVRSGAQRDQGPGLVYSGVTPNDFGGAAWWWFALDARLGIAAALQREAFSLEGSGAPSLQAALVRGHLGPTLRFRAGPVRLEGLVAYAFQQLPYFGQSAQPAFTAVARHALLLGARAQLDLGPVTLELKGDFPVALATLGAGSEATSLGGNVGGAVRVQLFRLGGWHFGALVDGAWTPDSVTVASGALSSQSVGRFGLGLDVQLRDVAPAPLRPPEPPAVQLAGLVVRCVDQTGAPTAAALVVAPEGHEAKPARCDEKGTARLDGLPLGPARVDATSPGRSPASAPLTLVAGENVVEVRLSGPKTGRLVLRVVDGATKQALPGAVVSIDGAAPAQSVEVDLPPGPHALKVTAPGYLAADEAVTVLEGQRVAIELALLKLTQRAPATLTVHVRDAKTGQSVDAQVELVGTGNKGQAVGALTLSIAGGTASVRVSAPGYLAQTRTVTVKDGDHAILNVDLTPKRK